LHCRAGKRLFLRTCAAVHRGYAHVPKRHTICFEVLVSVLSPSASGVRWLVALRLLAPFQSLLISTSLALCCPADVCNAGATGKVCCDGGKCYADDEDPLTPLKCCPTGEGKARLQGLALQADTHKPCWLGKLVDATSRWHGSIANERADFCRLGIRLSSCPLSGAEVLPAYPHC